MAEDEREAKLRREIHAVKDELAKLSKEFARFNERVRRLAAHIQQSHEDVVNVRNASEKIVKRFTAITKAKKRAKSPGSSP